MTSATETTFVATPRSRRPALAGLDRFAVPVAILLFWEAFARSGYLPSSLLPAPTAVLHRARRLDVRLR